jgi:SP family general alpha glucoside:H+ symporter-like MFS transporter
MADTKEEGFVTDIRAGDDIRAEKILITEATIGFATEKQLGPLEAAKAYPWAIIWSLVMGACVIMEGYDTALLGSFFAYRMLFSCVPPSLSLLTSGTILASFQIKFGRFVGVTPSTPSGYQLTAAWQSGVGQSTNVGGFIGAIVNGWLVTAYGQRRVVLWSLVSLMGLIFFTFFAPNLIVLTIGEFLLG